MCVYMSVGVQRLTETSSHFWVFSHDVLDTYRPPDRIILRRVSFDSFG